MIRHASLALALTVLGAQSQATTRYDEMLLETQVCAYRMAGAILRQPTQAPAIDAFVWVSARNLAGNCARDAPELSA